MRTTAQAFNEWMRRFIEEPDSYKSTVAEVKDFLAAEANGVEPDYGTWCEAYLARLMSEAD